MRKAAVGAGQARRRERAQVVIDAAHGRQPHVSARGRGWSWRLAPVALVAARERGVAACPRGAS